MTQQIKEEIPQEKKKSSKLAAVLIRSQMNMDPKQKDTLYMLRLRKKNSCVVIDDTDSNRGMMAKVKDWVAWGEISVETVKELEKKGKDLKFYNLHPPRGGFERKGIKAPFGKGGALGFRGDKINDLVKRML